MPWEKQRMIYWLNGCKNTKSRKAVIEVLENAENPLSAEDIFYA